MKKILLLFICTLIIPTWLLADVDLKTGDFHTNYKDIDYSALSGIILERNFNSASVTTGLFGYGWTSPYETKIYPIGDGNILIKEVGSTCQSCIENGSGNSSIFIKEKGFFELFFLPVQADQSKIDNAISQIVQMLIRDKKIENTPLEIAKKKRELSASMSQRAALWITYLEKGWLSNTAIADGKKWYSSNGELQNIEFKNDFFIRNYNNKSVERFNAKGVLLDKHDDKGKLVYQVIYVDEKINQIIDGMGHTFNFKLNDKGLVSAIKTKNEQVTFDYDDKNALIKSVGTDKQTRKYIYDVNKKMIGIEFGDIKTKVEYDPRNGRVISVTDSDGPGSVSTKKYTYNKILKDDGSVDPNKFITITTLKNYDDAEVENSNQFELKEILGRPYTYKTIVNKNGIKTETVFTECGCGPLSITRGTRYASFKYDGKSRMIEKEGRDYLLKATYNEEFDKITRIERKEKSSGNVEVTDFSYTEFGDVSKVQSKTIAVELSYNDDRKISKMISDQSILTFVYNKIGKPIEINMENVGSINVKYDEKGEIEKVESSAGHQMALKVTQAFQNLLTVIKPEGFNYNL